MTFAMVLISNGPFGGAQRRFCTLFFHLNRTSTNKFYFFVSHSMMYQINEVFPSENLEAIIPVGPYNSYNKIDQQTIVKAKQNKSKYWPKNFKTNIIYKIYYFIRNYNYQKNIFREIEGFRKQYGIRVFLGIYSGILPLYFYLKRTKRPGIIFSNMDSWFSNISENSKKDWYKKYALFNYAHENADIIDFLSPFIYEGLKKFGVKIPIERANITPCSFTDYSKCRIGEKSMLKIAFSGRLEKEKNPILFMHAALKLAKEYPNVEFHIMGDGRLSESVQELSSKYNFENIIYHGFHPNPPEILSETSIFVSIQSTNNYPSQSVLEAMACGNAIVATDVGDTRMFINELNGTLIPLETEALVKAIQQYIENPKSAEKKGLYAAEYVRSEFSIEKSAEYYADLFNKAAKKERIT